MQGKDLPSSFDSLSEELLLLEKLSKRYGIPLINREDGAVLSALAYYVRTLGGKIFVDAGAGIGYSTLWIIHGMFNFEHNEKVYIYVVEKNPARYKVLEDNIEKIRKNILSEKSFIDVKTINGDAVEFLDKIELSLDMVFVDIEKNQYKQVLSFLPKKLSKIGIGIFHNALIPGLDSDTRKFLEQQKQFSYYVVPTHLGLLIVKRLY
jgi:predicted O-methyltransferase YrrM